MEFEKPLTVALLLCFFCQNVKEKQTPFHKVQFVRVEQGDLKHTHAHLDICLFTKMCQ